MTILNQQSFAKVGVLFLLVASGFSLGCSTMLSRMSMLPNSRLANKASQTNLTWLTSYDQALTQSQQTGKPILANFTGSDWCKYCQLLHEEVFDTPEFADWSQKNVVLLELDFPRRNTQIPAIVAQNQDLAQQFEIRSYPTVLIIGEDGEVIARQGYLKGGPQGWITAAQQQLDVAANSSR